MADNNEDPTSPLTDAPPDPRIVPARLAFGAELLTNGTTVMVRNYLLDGKPIQVALYEDGRIEQRDTASHVTKISNLTIKITINGMPFEIDQHSILSTPNDLTYAINGREDEVQVLRTLGRKLQGVDTIAMVHFKYFLNTGVVDTSKAQSVTHGGPSSSSYKLSVQLECLRLAVTLKAPRFLTHVIKEIEYIWLSHDLCLPQLLALVQVAPYLDKFLILWTFAVSTRNLAQKDYLISCALASLPHYRNLVRQHALRYAGRPMIPSVHSFVTGVAYVPNKTSSTLQPSGSNSRSPIANVGLATPSTDNGNVEEDNSGEDGEVMIGKRPQPQNDD